jgi:hypothetical protein
MTKGDIVGLLPETCDTYSTGFEMWWKITKIQAPEILLKDIYHMMEIIMEAIYVEESRATTYHYSGEITSDVKLTKIVGAIDSPCYDKR